MVPAMDTRKKTMVLAATTAKTTMGKRSISWLILLGVVGAGGCGRTVVVDRDTIARYNSPAWTIRRPPARAPSPGDAPPR